MTVEIELFESLDALERAAGDALARAARPSLYDRLDWYRLLARHCPPEGRFLALEARSGPRRAWLILSVAHPVAQSYASWYSLRFGPIGDGDEDLLAAMAAALREGGIAQIELAPLEDPEPLARAFKAAGWFVFPSPRTANWRVDTAGQDFEAYWAGRPARLRNTAKRKARSHPLEIEIFESFDEAAWAAYEKVYRSSWKPEEGSPDFLRALAGLEGAAGTLRLGIARSQGEPVAAQLWLVENGEATIHKLAYVESAKAGSPGTVLGLAMFRHVLDKDRVGTIDYGTGDEPYKADWMGERRMLWQLTAFNPRTVKGWLGAGRAWASALAGRRRSR